MKAASPILVTKNKNECFSNQMYFLVLRTRFLRVRSGKFFDRVEGNLSRAVTSGDFYDLCKWYQYTKNEVFLYGFFH